MHGICVHVCVCACARAHPQMHSPGTHTHTRTDLRTHTCTDTPTHMHNRVHHARAHTHTHTHTHKHTHQRAPARAHMHRHTRVHTDTHNPLCGPLGPGLWLRPSLSTLPPFCLAFSIHFACYQNPLSSLDPRMSAIRTPPPCLKLLLCHGGWLMVAKAHFTPQPQRSPKALGFQVVVDNHAVDDSRACKGWNVEKRSMVFG